LRRPRVELLEPRALLTTFVVTSTADTIADDGVVTLREAITAANTDAASGDAPAGSSGLDTIDFDIQGNNNNQVNGAWVIDITNDNLPTITEPLVIDGYSQPGSSANTNPVDQPDNAVPLIQINGSPGGFNTGLTIDGTGSTVKGLIITGFRDTGLGAITLGAAASGNHIAGNFLGTNPTGTAAAGNYYGVDVQGHDNVIGGTDPADRNLISTNVIGVVVHNAPATNNVIEGNFVGMQADGTSAFPLGQEGIVTDQASGTVIGGTTQAARNVIAGAPGILVSSSTNTTIEGNFIGVDRTGLAGLTSLDAIDVTGSDITQIGGTVTGAGNVLAAGANDPSPVNVIGINIDKSTTTVVQGNAIGTDPTGAVVLGNSNLGVQISQSNGTTIGGTQPGDGNIIANNHFSGAGNSIRLLDGSALMEGNSLFGNDSSAIDGSTIPTPTLVSASATTIQGDMNGLPGTIYRIEYFATLDTGVTSQLQAQTFLGFEDVTTDGNGHAALSFDPAGGVPADQFITATATENGTSTSNLSAVVSASLPVADVGVSITDAPDPVTAGGKITYTITVSNQGPDTALDVELLTTVPAGATFVSFTSPSGWNGTMPAVGGTGDIDVTTPSLAVGGGSSATFTLVVQVDPAAQEGSTVDLQAGVGSFTNDNNRNNSSADVQTTVAAPAAPSADVGVSVTDGPDPVAAGGKITYTITVANQGPDAAQSVDLSTAIPAGATFVSLSSPSGWNATTPAVGGTGAIDVTAPSLAAGSGSTAIFTLVVQVDPGAQGGSTVNLQIHVESTTADGDPNNNSASTLTTVATSAPANADLGIAITDGPEPVAAGENLIYTINVIDHGPGTAQTVNFSTAVPAGATFVSLTTPNGWTASTPVVGGTGAIKATTSSLGAGNASAATFILTVNVNGNATNGSSLSLFGAVSSSTTDPNLSNNSAVEPTIITAPSTDPNGSSDPNGSDGSGGTVGSTDTVGPIPTNVQRYGFHAQPTLIAVTFNEPLAPAGATNLNNYQLTAAGPDGRLGTRDDVTITLKSVALDPTSQIVVLAPRHPLALRQSYQLVIAGGSNGVTDLAGNGVDSGSQVVQFDQRALAGRTVDAPVVPGGVLRSQRLESARVGLSPGMGWRKSEALFARGTRR